MSDEKLPLEDKIDIVTGKASKLAEIASKLAKEIFRTPYGFLVIVLCIVNYYQYKSNLDCHAEYKNLSTEYVNSLKSINTDLKNISDTVKIDTNAIHKK